MLDNATSLPVPTYLAFNCSVDILAPPGLLMMADTSLNDDGPVQRVKVRLAATMVVVGWSVRIPYFFAFDFCLSFCLPTIQLQEQT